MEKRLGVAGVTLREAPEGGGFEGEGLLVRGGGCRPRPHGHVPLCFEFWVESIW
jgi:hypothetical protein